MLSTKCEKCLFANQNNGNEFTECSQNIIRKIKSDTGTPANENEEGVNEYFYSEFPPHNEMQLLN